MDLVDLVDLVALFPVTASLKAHNDYRRIAEPGKSSLHQGFCGYLIKTPTGVGIMKAVCRIANSSAFFLPGPAI